MSKVIWSKYNCHNFDDNQEGNTTLSKDFNEIINAEKWEQEGYEVVVSQ